MGKVYTRQRGKVAREDDVFVRRCGDHDISVRRKEGYQYTRSEEQRVMRVSFGERAKRAAAWRRANSDPPSPEYKRMMRRYKTIRKKQPGRYFSFWNFLVSNCT